MRLAAMMENRSTFPRHTKSIIWWYATTVSSITNANKGCEIRLIKNKKLKHSSASREAVPRYQKRIFGRLSFEIHVSVNKKSQSAEGEPLGRLKNDLETAHTLGFSYFLHSQKGQLDVLPDELAAHPGRIGKFRKGTSILELYLG